MMISQPSVFRIAMTVESGDLICLKPGWVGDAAAAVPWHMENAAFRPLFRAFICKVLTAKDKVFQGCVNHVAELRDKGADLSLLHGARERQS